MKWLPRFWYRISFVHLLLWPISLLFRLLVAVRRELYRAGVLGSVALPVPVIVVGNITVGGSGKTPLVLWLVDMLRQHGFAPGVISRGYGAHITSPIEVTATSSPREGGDEPLLLARRAKCPVWVCPDRVAAGAALLRAHPECNVIISDDGLQHYRLKRAIEIAVVDSERRAGNGLMLPAGPLREPKARLGEVDIVVSHLTGPSMVDGKSAFEMRLDGDTFINLRHPALRRKAGDFTGLNLCAVAGIGHPQRFFAYLQRLGLAITAHAFEDHHEFKRKDIDCRDADAILMTEKDAVKCGAIADDRCWALIVDAQVSPGLARIILEKLHGRSIA